MKKILLSISLIAISVFVQAQVVTTMAGTGSQGSVNATGTSASFNSPTSTYVDPTTGNIFVADYANNLIRKITPSQVVTTFAGSGAQGSTDATGTAASFFNPYGVCVDASGNVFVTDQDNHTIRKITPAGVVTTLAGQVGVSGGADGTGTGATFNTPRGICIDPTGNLYVTDYLGHKIRKVTQAGVVTTLAGSGSSGALDGTGAAATFNRPSGICISPSGDFYVADRSNNKIRKITPTGIVTTYAGSGAVGSANGTGTAATFNLPFGVVCDAAGVLFVADFNNSRIRMITTSTVVSHFAGSGSVGAVDATGTSASFNGPIGLSKDAVGNLYIADQFNHKIRKITNPAAGISEKNLSESLTVYPNPSTDNFNIDLKLSSSIIVVNYLGQVILEQTFNAGKQTINLQNQAKGVYFMTVKQGGKEDVIKLIKE